MKKIIILLITACLCGNVSAQEEQYAYCIMQCFGKVFSTKYIVTLDFGEKASERKQIYENGEKKHFNSNGESLNYMGRRGWKVVSTYIDRDFKNQQILYFVLEKKITQESDVFKDLEFGNAD